MNIFTYLKELKNQFFDCSPFFDFARDILDPAARNLQQISNRRKRNETRILDIGCGTGRCINLPGCDTYIGIDVNSHFITYLNKIRPQNAHLFLMSADYLGFQERSLDLVVMLDLTHHLSDRQVIEAINQVKRIADRHIIVIDPVRGKGSYLRNMLYNLDRGQYIRTFKEMKELIKSVSPIEEAALFKSGLYIKCCLLLAACR